jgi:uncharacterized membrane protein YphA (DoxX/SURF4 family)
VDPGVALRLDPVVVLALRLALAALFAAAAVHKARDRAGFRAALGDYRLLPEAAVPAAAVAVALGEAALALALLVPATAPAAGLAAAGLLAVYAFAIGANLARGRRHVACGCLGPAAEQPIHAGLLVRNGALIVAAGVAALPAASRPLVPLDAFTAVAAAMTLALLYAAADGLMAAARTAALLDAPREAS